MSNNDHHTFVYDKFIHDLLHAADNNSPSDDGWHHHHNNDAILIHKHDDDPNHQHYNDRSRDDDDNLPLDYFAADHTHTDTPKDRDRYTADQLARDSIARHRAANDPRRSVDSGEGTT